MRIVIADKGAGIAPADLPHVFDPYFTTKRGGTGLGLPIAKNIVEGLSGTIAVSSDSGRGTEIHIVFPTRPFDSPRTQSAKVERLAQGKPPNPARTA